MLTGSAAFFTIADDLINAVHARLRSDGTGRFDRVGVVNGAISWDEPECELLVIAPVRIFIAETFPEPANVAMICDAPYLVAEYAIQAIQCAPTQTESANPPTVAALRSSAQTVITNATLILQETTRYLCELRDSDTISDYITTPSVFVGPQGGAVGSELHVHVSLLRGIE